MTPLTSTRLHLRYKSIHRCLLLLLRPFVLYLGRGAVHWHVPRSLALPQNSLREDALAALRTQLESDGFHFGCSSRTVCGGVGRWLWLVCRWEEGGWAVWPSCVGHFVRCRRAGRRSVAARE